MLVSLPAGICAIFGVLKLVAQKKLFDPCWDRCPVMKYVKQLHQCHSSSIQSFELLFSNGPEAEPLYPTRSILRPATLVLFFYEAHVYSRE